MITTDALHFQHETARLITQDLGTDYLLGLKSNQSGILERAMIKLPQDFLAEYDTGWIKDHGRLNRWRLQRVNLSQEEAGLCGCWQFVSVWRGQQK